MPKLPRKPSEGTKVGKKVRSKKGVKKAVRK